MGKNKKQNPNKPIQILYNALSLILVMFIFLVSLKLMGGSFKLFGKEAAHEIINATSNPFVSLFIGLLATAIIQSSSTTTSMVVAMVAAGTLSIGNAVPMIMGANIGTSVTSSIVSLGHIGNKREYKKAISAATVHDFFNIMVVLFLFPLELFFGFLSKLSAGIAGFFTAGAGNASGDMFSILAITVKPTAKFIIETLDKNAWYCLGIALILLFFSLRYLTVLLKKLLIGKAEKKLDKLIFNKPIKAIGWGTVLTMAVQSSSVTTSLIVPMVASNKVSLRKAFPFMMGANIGTTITALIAALSTDANVFKVALTIALAHVLFNVLGATFLFPIKPLREIPIKLSRKLGKATMKNRLVGMAYIVVTFFLIPFVLILVSDNKLVIKKYNIVNTELTSGNSTFTIFEDQVDQNSSIINRKVYLNMKDDNEYNVSKPTYSQKISRKGNLITIGDDLYITSPIGFCFDRNELKGKVTLCMKKILPNYKLNENVIIDTCYVYSKTFENAELVDSITQKLYLDVKDLLIVKSEIISKKGKVIYTEELQ